VTTERRALLLLLGLPLLAAGCANMNENRRGDSVDVSSYPPDIQRAYRVFALRCSRCHTLARPLNARIYDAQHWVRYVARMRRQPGSGIDERNGELILKFLLYYHRQPGQDEEPQGPVESEPSAFPAQEQELAPEPEPAPAEPQPEPPVAPEPPPELPPAPTGLDDTTSAPDSAPHGGDS
jgi:hypothetical protein